MSFWAIMNYAAWAGSALIFYWLIRDFLRTDKEYDEDFLLGKYTEEEIDLSGEGGQS